MPAYRSFLFFLGFCLSLVPLHSQANKNGLPFITNYPYHRTGGSEQNWCITQDHRGIIYVGNNDRGVLEYDGVEWRQIPLPDDPIVRSLVTGEDGVVYVGAESEFGFLAPDELGTMKYWSLSDTINQEIMPFTSVWKTYYVNNKVYFCTFSRIFIYDPASKGMEVIETPRYAFFSFIIDSTLYVPDYGEGLLIYKNGGYVSVPGGEFFREKNISGLVQYDSCRFLIGTVSKGLHLINTLTGNVDTLFVNNNLQVFLKENFITCIQPLNSGYAVGTMRGGLAIINQDGDLEYMIGEEQGLLDNSIVSFFINKGDPGDGQLWIANFMGVSRIDLSSPFRIVTFGGRRGSIFSQTQGELVTDMALFKGEMFVSTYNGLYRSISSLLDTRFIPLPEFADESIRQLYVFKTSEGVELLLALSGVTTYVIDKDLNVSELADLVINSNLDPERRERYAGEYLVQDPKRPDIIYTGRRQIFGLQYENGLWKEISRYKGPEEDRILTAGIDKHGNLWTATANSLIRIDISRKIDTTLKSFQQSDGLPSGENNQVFINPESGEILLGTSNGFYRYNNVRDIFYPDTLFNSVLPAGDIHINKFHVDHDGDYWISLENESSRWTELVLRRLNGQITVLHDKVFERFPGEPAGLFFDDPQSGYWLAKGGNLISFDKQSPWKDTIVYLPLIRNVVIGRDSVVFSGTNFAGNRISGYKIQQVQSEVSQPTIKFAFNSLRFSWAAPLFVQDRRMEFSYYLEGFDEEWSLWTRATSKEYTSLPSGQYTFYVKVRNSYGSESEPASYMLRILRPWYASIGAVLLYMVLLGLVILLVILYVKNLKKRSVILEKKNREIELQKKELENLNDEVTAQRDEIEAQRDSLERQKDLIDRQNKAITDSILYASRIQEAVFPDEEVMRFLLPKHFVFYKPRDIVSGDFYWVDKKHEKVMLALGDCTGHGVPGAFMSMLGISLLNEISSKYPEHSTNELMDELRDQVITSLGQTGEMDEAKDGMDMGMLAINTSTREIQFTGAHHNLYLFVKGELVEVRGDRMPVGIHSMANTLFSAHNMKLGRGDTLYLFSDGYPDQFGGERRKKYSYPRIKKLLTDIQDLIMHDQLEIISREFDKWKGDHEQIDDVLMIGIKL